MNAEELTELMQLTTTTASELGRQTGVRHTAVCNYMHGRRRISSNWEAKARDYLSHRAAQQLEALSAHAAAGTVDK